MRQTDRNKVLKSAAKIRENFTHGQVPELILCMVTGATLVKYPDTNPATSKYMWQYNVVPAKLTYAGIGNFPTVTVRNASAEIPAFSISELGNNANTPAIYSYGVPTADIPAGFAPVRIPDNTPVICWNAMRSNNHGQNIFLIINTQAITGQC